MYTLIIIPGKCQKGIGNLDQQVDAISNDLMPQLLKNIDTLDFYVNTHGVKLVDASVGLHFTKRPIFQKDIADYPSTSSQSSPKKITGGGNSDSEESNDSDTDMSSCSQESLPGIPPCTPEKKIPSRNQISETVTLPGMSLFRKKLKIDP